jgi:hypothetical protein
MKTVPHTEGHVDLGRMIALSKPLPGAAVAV